MRLPSAALAALLAAAAAQAQEVVAVPSTLETPQLTEADADSDADDPAFWVPAGDPAGTLVVTAVKNGGIRVYDLQGQEVQALAARPGAGGEDDPDGRINNVDVVYGLAMADGTRQDVVLASDRGLDVLRVFRVGPEGLEEITAPDQARAFPAAPDPAGGPDLDNPLPEQMTIYGIDGWADAEGTVWAVGTQRTNPRLGIFRLEARADGTVASELVHDVRVPFAFRGQDLTAESDEDPAQDWSPQFEGVAVDPAAGVIYAGQEDVGVWRIDAATGAVGAGPLVTTRGAPGSSFRDESSVISRDLEGLVVLDAGGEKLLLVSSQGGAHGDAPLADPPYDDSFAVFAIGADGALTHRGSFRVAAAEGRDAVQESDGADVLLTAVPGFPNGLLVVQDGYDDDLDGLDGEVASTNFKFVDWGAVARALDLPTDPAQDPRG